MANWLVAPLLLRHFRRMSDAATETMIIAPDPDAPGLSQPVTGVDESGAPVTLPVVTEKPLTLFLNRQEIVTSMTIGEVMFGNIGVPTRLTFSAIGPAVNKVARLDELGGDDRGAI